MSEGMAVDRMLVSPKFIWCNLILNVMASGGGVFGRWSGLDEVAKVRPP